MLDAVVVGGGVSGIAAAERLAAGGASLVLLEARGRLGGRVATASVGGVPVERGGEFLDAAPDGHLLPLLERLGVRTAPASHGAAGHRTGTLGVGTVHVGGARRDSAELPARAVAAVEALEVELAELAERIDPFRPWELEGAGALDAASLADRLVALGADAEGLALGEALLATGGSTVPIDAMSTLAMAAKQANRGPEEGRLSLRLAGGAAALDHAVRARLGDALRLATPVVAVEQDADGVTVETRSGERLRARLTVLAVPPTAWRALAIEPAPSAARREALAAVRLGHVLKAHLVYPEPWWRELMQARLPAATDLACGHVYEARVTEAGAALSCFVGGVPARRLYAMAPAVRPGAMLAALEAVFGQRLAPPRALRLDAWNEAPFTGGSYLVYRPGQLTRHRDALARAEGRVIAAGAEASSMPSYVGGAAEGGARAAETALALLA